MSRIKRQKGNSKYKRNTASSPYLSRINPQTENQHKVEGSIKMHAIANDEELLERARFQWQQGDWVSLASLSHEMIENNSERSKLALLVAASHQQLGDQSAAKYYIKLAQKWGCDTITIIRILIAGVYSTLGKAATILQNEPKSQKYFSSFSQITGIKKRVINNNLSSETYINSLIIECFVNDDFFEKIDLFLLGNKLSAQDKFTFCLKLSDRFYQRNDNLMAQHFINCSKRYLSKNSALSKQQKILIAKKFLQIGRATEALDSAIEKLIHETDLTEAEIKSLIVSYETLRLSHKAKFEHGHELLLNYLKTNQNLYTKNLNPLTLIEIGTTREEVSEQGSTLKFAQYCKSNNIKFITVDMDPHNTVNAKSMFLEFSSDFQAITMKGEDFLQQYSGPMDFVFLDAYDFDHGGHSKLRQNRYEKFLGAQIDDKLCHQMHLDCARSIVDKLSINGLVCIDDTWLDDKGQWCAKGTLAMPFLLQNGFEILEARNRAALLQRKV